MRRLTGDQRNSYHNDRTHGLYLKQNILDCSSTHSSGNDCSKNEVWVRLPLCCNTVWRRVRGMDVKLYERCNMSKLFTFSSCFQERWTGRRRYVSASMSLLMRTSVIVFSVHRMKIVWQHKIRFSLCLRVYMWGTHHIRSVYIPFVRDIKHTSYYIYIRCFCEEREVRIVLDIYIYIYISVAFVRNLKYASNYIYIGLERREYGRRDPSRWPRGTLYPQKLALTSPTSGGRSLGIVRLQTKTTE
jgi:hypothetical protein